MAKSVKNFLLESEKDKDENFAYLDKDVISKVNDVDYNSKDNYIVITFSTTYGKEFKLALNLSDFKNWLNKHLKSEEDKVADVFHKFLADFFESSKEEKEELKEIIDDTNEIMPDDDLPANASNRMVGTQHTMDLEKIFKRSMPKSVRNYSGNLGLGTVVW